MDLDALSDAEPPSVAPQSIFGPQNNRIYPDRPHVVCEVPKFDKFDKLPAELRTRIFEDALYTGQLMRPHLCDRQTNGSIKFHDDSQHSRVEPRHDAIYKLLGVTFVSKAMRKESLP